MRLFCALLFMLGLFLPRLWADSVACSAPDAMASSTGPASLIMHTPASQLTAASLDHFSYVVASGLPVADQDIIVAMSSSAMSWDKIFAGNHGCYASPDEHSTADQQPPDSHELDLLLYPPRINATVPNIPVLAHAYQLHPSPVFRSYRPPSLTA